MQLRRKLYSRGSSFETTIPRPLLFHLNSDEPADVLFEYDVQLGKWTIQVAPRNTKKEPKEKRPKDGGA